MARLDTELVRRGLARSRGDARDLVAAGQVIVDGRVATKSAQPVSDAVVLTVEHEGPRWVGRGGRKLDHALRRWAPDGLCVAGRRCVDVGASTGGFSQALLAAGAASVVAVDVGHDQLVAEISEDPRVLELSGTTVRGLSAPEVGGPADLVVVDLSFISLTTVMADLVGLLAPTGDLVLLVKPQFEVGRGRLSRTGLVKGPADRAAALTAVIDAARAHGLGVLGLTASPLRGSTGNAEYLLWARREASATMDRNALREIVREITTQVATGGGR
ncbi:MAG: TlyA family RNA methyltransferase [Ornithinibacter sp.]